MEALPLRRPQSERTCPSQQRERVGPEWEYLHFLAIMDFLLCLRDWGPVQNHFWIKPRELGADDCDGVVHFVCSAAQLLAASRGINAPQASRRSSDDAETGCAPSFARRRRQDLHLASKPPEQKATFVFFLPFSEREKQKVTLCYIYPAGAKKKKKKGSG